MKQQDIPHKKVKAQGFHDAFISYGRKESKAFALKLHNQLSAQGYDIWLDQDDIPLGVDFQDEIDKGIANAHNFIFIIAPHAINSIYCRKEIELAIKYKKRIIPILHVEEQLGQLHPGIGKINWLYMRQKVDRELPQEEWRDIDAYDAAYQGLVSLLEKDKAYVHQHTVLLKKALEWESNRQDSKFLLVGKERMHAETWLLKAMQQKELPTQPSDLHCEYICEAKKNAENLMTDVFISYASEHSELRDRVKNTLSRHAITTWVHNKDIRSGQDFAKAIDEGIEQADNLVFLISNHALQSAYCLKELEYALSLNKRIIPVLIEKDINVEQPPALASLQYIDLLNVEDERVFQSKIQALVGQLQDNRRYYQQHKILLTQALKWERQERNHSILLRGYNLQNAQAWLKIGKKKGKHGPVRLHEEFIEVSTSQSGQQNLEVFVSYSRTDGDFARKINEQLQLNGKTTWFDQESIATGSDFQREIEKGIEQADNFLFIISPEAVESEYCANEVAYASQLNKRFVTVYYRDTDPKTMPPELAAVQWINFKELDFHSAFSQLVRTLDTDREHLQAHTRWQRRAMEWQDHQKDKSRLLRGSEFALADAWLQEALEKQKKPVPTELQETFIKESGKAIIAAQQKEHKVNQRLKLFLVASILALLAALGGIYYAWTKSVEAKESERIARDHETEAKLKEAKALQAEKEARRAEEQALKAAEMEKLAQQRTKETLQELQLKEVALEKALEDARRNGRIAEENALEAEISRVKAEIEALHMKNFSKVIRLAKQDPTLAISALQLINKKANKDEFTDFIYNIFSGNSLYSQNLTHHQDRIYALATSPNGGYVISGGRDKAARVWDREGNLLLTFNGHDKTVFSLAFDASSNTIFSGSYDKTAKLWDLKGNVLLTLEHERSVWSVAVSPDGAYLATGLSDSLSFIWDKSGNLQTTLPTKDDTYSISFSKDGKHVLTASGKTAQLWDLEGNLIKQYAHDKTVYKAVFSPDGQKVLTGSWDRTSKLWSLEGILLQTFDSDYTYSVDFAPNGEEVLTSGLDKEVKIWGLNGQLIRTLKGHGQEIRTAIFSGDNNQVISGSYDGSVKFWPLRGRISDRFQSDRFLINGYDIDEKHQLIAYIGKGNKVVIRNHRSKEEVELNGHTKDIMDVAFSPSGDTLVSIGSDKKIIFWSRKGGELFSIQDNSELRQVSYSHDGKLIATCNDKREICIWSHKGKLKKRISAAHMGRITSLNFSPNNNYILSTSADKTATLWTTSGEAVHSFADYDSYIFYGTFSPDGKKILLGGQSNTANLYDLEGNLLQVFKGHTSYVISCAFSPDGKFIVTGSTDRSVRLWSTDGTLFQKIDDHKDIVNTVLFSEDGAYLLTASEDGDVKIRLGFKEPLTLMESGRLAEFNANDFAKAGILDITDYTGKLETQEMLTLADIYVNAAESAERQLDKEDMLGSALNIIDPYLEKEGLSGEVQVEVYKKAAKAYGLLGKYKGMHYGKKYAGNTDLEKALGFYEKLKAQAQIDIDDLHRVSELLNLLELSYSAQGNTQRAAEVKASEIEILQKIAETNPSEHHVKSKIAHAMADYAYVQIKLGKYAVAVATMDQMEKQFPDQSWYKVRQFTALMLNGDQQKALAIINQLNEQDYVQKEFLFTEEFDGDNRWPTGINGANNVTLNAEGYLDFERTDTRNGWNYQPIPISTEQDFEIEASIRFVRGVENNSYTLDFGHDAKYYHTFGFSPGGYYVIRSYINDEWVDYKPWLKSSLVNRTDFNKLTVRKVGEKMYFFLNGQLVHHMPFESKNWFGDNIGFSVQDTSLMQIDYLRVSQLHTEQPTDDFLILQKDKYPWLQNYRYTFKQKFFEEFEKLRADGIQTKALLKQWRTMFDAAAEKINVQWPDMPYKNPDAVVYWPKNQKAYFFKGEEYVRFDLVKNKMDSGYPKLTKSYWPGVNVPQVDAACYLPEQDKAFIFSGNRFILYDALEDKVERGYPKPIDETNLPGVTFPKIDAAVSLQNGKSYFFYKDQYIRFDRRKFKADPGYPKKLSKENWIGLEFGQIDAAIETGNGKISLFSNGMVDYPIFEIE